MAPQCSLVDDGLASNTCMSTIDLTTGDSEESSYRELWEGAEAVYWMCIRRGHGGVSIGHGMYSIFIQVFFLWH